MVTGNMTFHIFFDATHLREKRPCSHLFPLRVFWRRQMGGHELEKNKKRQMGGDVWRQKSLFFFCVRLRDFDVLSAILVLQDHPSFFLRKTSRTLGKRHSANDVYFYTHFR